MFVSQNPYVNSYALGEENPYIVVNSGILDLLSEAEIRAMLAHELGHIKCGHTMLIQMAIWLMNTASVIGELTLGIGNFVGQALIFAFFEWRRKAELSSDRASLLVVDDLNTVMSLMMKISGGCHHYAHECSLSEFIAQSEKYQALDENGLNQIYKFLLYNGFQGAMLSHPFPVERLHYLKSWADSEEYQQIRQGNYQRSPAPGAVNVSVENPTTDVESLRRQITELQQEIDRIKKSESDHRGNSH